MDDREGAEIFRRDGESVMTAIEKLRQRVEVMRQSGKWGKCKVFQLARDWFISINGYCREVCGGDIDLWNGYLDGLESKVKARRLIADLQSSDYGLTEQQQRVFIDAIRREFNVEEGS